MTDQTFMTTGDKIAAINSYPSAYRTLDLMADAAVMCLAPPPRGVKTAKTIGEIADLFVLREHGWPQGEEDLPLTVADLVFGLTVIWAHYAAGETMTARELQALTGRELSDCEAEEAKRQSRATTLREIAEHLSALSGIGQPSESWSISRKRCHAVWSRVAEAYPGDDGRALAIRETWGREARFLAD